MENQPKLSNSKEIIAYLAERFPLCFVAEGEARPLKIGIFKELLERLQQGGDETLSKTQLRSALRLYTSSWRYLYGVKEGAQRVDLEGNACGELSAEHIEHAKKQLAEAKARVQAQRVARQEQKREENGSITQRQPAAGKITEPADNKVNRTTHTRTKQSTAKQARTEAGVSKASSQPRQQPKVDKQSPKPVIADIAQLQVGQYVRVKAGKSAMDATILEIAKDGVHVQLSSGLAMIVRAEHLQF